MFREPPGETPEDPSSEDPSSGQETSHGDAREDRCRPAARNRHGLPFLEKGRSLAGLFEQEAEKAQEASKDSCTERFPELLSVSLKGKDQDALLREKKDRPPPRPVPLKKRLKRYPPPQVQLDLHGFTATRARSHAEAWLRRHWRNGFFTVRIVVGRGLHSEAGAVLPDVVEDLMPRLKRDGVVLWFEWDRREKSRSGAVIVYLKQFP